MSDRPDAPLDRCLRRARIAPAKALPDSAPTGFATRVLARWREAESRDWTLWLLPRAIGVAAACAAALFAIHAFQPHPADASELGSLVMNLALGDQP